MHADNAILDEGAHLSQVQQGAARCNWLPIPEAGTSQEIPGILQPECCANPKNCWIGLPLNIRF